MSDAARGADRGWLGPVLGVVLAVTVFRVVLLAWNRTDLFVDEAQYWLWGQRLDWGYYSKPPLIGWVIRAFTEIGGSDGQFWIRLPGPLFHGATALILARVAWEAFGSRAAVWTAAVYVTFPFVALGSLLASTDTMLAPFWALALLFWLRLCRGDGDMSTAALAGAAAGMAVMGKYAGFYLPLCAGLAAVLVPAARPGWRVAGVSLAVMAAVVAPNMVWNALNGFETLSHTADNAAWVRRGFGEAGVSGAVEFLATQVAVLGPVALGVLVWRWLRPGSDTGRVLVVLSVPIVAVVTVQAFLAEAYGNWAVTAYLAGAVLIGATLATRPVLGLVAVGVNLLAVVALPVLSVVPETTLGRDRPVMARYLGRADLSRDILRIARETGAAAVVASNRDVLADLHHTGRDAGLPILAAPFHGRADNFYEVTFAMDLPPEAQVLAVGREDRMGCPAERQVFPLTAGRNRGGLVAALMPARCVTGRL
jgi:4-amino-4-deoxy-L-arabinose transferase-like glycosyltransferase